MVENAKHPEHRLGKKHAVARTSLPALKTYTVNLPTAPAAINWSGNVSDYGVMLNNTLGCCTCAAVGHAIQIWTLNGVGKESTIPDNSILTLYEYFGYVPGNESTDNGAVEADVLDYWLKYPVNGFSIDAYVKVDETNQEEVKDCIWLFGLSYVGIGLPLSAQNQVGAIWDVAGDLSAPNNKIFSWGGHAVIIISYGAEGLTCITWGKLQKMTWAFFNAYCDEAYAILSPVWYSRGSAPSGFDKKALLTDVEVYKNAA